MATVAELIARRLSEAGVRFAFGIPGGEVLTLVDALEAAGIRFVLAKHENAAGFMAEGAHHATGAPAVLVATIGPGVANAVNVVANAQQDRVPLILLTGCVDAAEAVTYNHQVFDHGAVLAPLVKASIRVAPGAADAIVDKAVALALDPQPGPVHLDVPIGVAAAAEPERPAVRRARAIAGSPPPGRELNEAQRLFARAERPIVLAGLDLLAQDGATALAELAHRWQVPVITTYKAKGVLDEDDPLALGGAGLSPVADRRLLPVLRDADLVLLAGYDPIEMRVGWRDPFAPGQTVIELAAVPNRHYMHQATMSFVGDVAAGLWAIADGAGPKRGWSENRLAAVKADLASDFRVGEEWGPAAIVDEVRKALPRTGVATVDSGAHRILLSQVWRCHEPRTLLQSTGLCTMGCALPLAAGHALAEPGRPVVCFTGDGGLEMVLGELATLRDIGRPVIVVVFVDASLALIELKQRTSGLASHGVDMPETDFAAIARAVGGRGAVVESRAALRREMAEALAADRFTVLACRIPRHSYDGRI